MYSMVSRIVVFCATTIVLASGPVRAQESQSISMSELRQDVAILLAEIESIRRVLGIQLPPDREFVIRDAEPRQVFFQAQTLFRKTNTLAQEIAGISRQAPTPAPVGEISNSDVHTLLGDAQQQLGYVKDALGISQAIAPPELKRRSTAGDVVHDIVEAGYVLNELVTRQPDWASIYERILQMVTYVGGALEAQDRFPPLPQFSCCKMPEDVYQRLLTNMEATRGLAASMQLTFMRIESRKRPPHGASTGTVYDLTTTMVSDLGELTLRLDGEDVTYPEYDRPLRIFPSHAFQLAGVLETQLAMLREQKGAD